MESIEVMMMNHHPHVKIQKNPKRKIKIKGNNIKSNIILKGIKIIKRRQIQGEVEILTIGLIGKIRVPIFIKANKIIIKIVIIRNKNKIIIKGISFER